MGSEKPMILIRFDEAFSESLHNSRQGFEHLTIVKPHSVLQGFILPTLCLMEIQEQGTCALLSRHCDPQNRSQHF
jgi:hypothetical protein